MAFQQRFQHKLGPCSFVFSVLHLYMPALYSSQASVPAAMLSYAIFARFLANPVLFLKITSGPAFCILFILF
jgi:hypothetical protein